MYLIATLYLIVAFGWTFGAALVLISCLLLASAIPQGWLWRKVLSEYRKIALVLGIALLLASTGVFGAAETWLAP